MRFVDSDHAEANHGNKHVKTSPAGGGGSGYAVDPRLGKIFEIDHVNPGFLRNRSTPWQRP
jgi:hypothetical protein